MSTCLIILLILLGLVVVVGGVFVFLRLVLTWPRF